MPTTLRLPPDLETALKDRAESSGRSQQDLIRDAIRSSLHEDVLRGLPTRDRPKLRAPRIPFREAEQLLPLPPGVASSLELLDRSERV